MNIFDFSMENLYAERKKSYVYGIAVSIAVSVLYVFFNLYCIFNTSKYKAMVEVVPKPDGSTANEILKNSAFLIFILVMIFVSVMCIYYANSYYLVQKKKDIGILLISGGNMTTLIKFLSAQNFVILSVAIPLGFLFGGICLTPIFNFVVRNMTQLDIPSFVFSFSAIGYTIVVCVLFVIFLIIANAGYIYRSEMIDLFKDDEEVKRYQKIKIPDFIPFAGYIMMLVLGFLNADIEGTGVQFAFVALICISIYLSQNCDSFFIFLQKQLLNNRHRHVYLGNVRNDLTNCGRLYIVLFMTILLILQILYITCGEIVVNTLAMCCFTIAILLLGGCVVFKQCLSAVARKEMYKRLLCLGYLEKDLKKIIRREIALFYLIVIIFAQICFYLVCYNIKIFVSDMNPFYILLIAYPVVLMMYMFLTQYLYNKIIFSEEN